MLPRPIRGPAARSALATRMLTGKAMCCGEMFPVTRELQLVSMSVGPRYSRAVLVRWYSIDDTLRVFDESVALKTAFFPEHSLP